MCVGARVCVHACVRVIQGSDFPQICSDELLENKQCQYDEINPDDSV